MRRRWRWAIVLLCLVVLAPVAGALVPRPLFRPSDQDAISARRQVLMLSNPIHTDIAFPADPDILARFGFLADAGLPLSSPGLRWIVVGWGGRAFYIETPAWSELKPLPVLKALTVDRSVMHVALAGDIDASHPSVLSMQVSPERVDRMVDAVMASFAAGDDGRPQEIAGAAYGEFDRFYEANGWFSALRGCNTWTGAILREGGFRTGLWNPLPQSLSWSMHLFNGPPNLIDSPQSAAVEPK
jgi:uncharacterized protein (TIGR02117 family)